MTEREKWQFGKHHRDNYYYWRAHIPSIQRWPGVRWQVNCGLLWKEVYHQVVTIFIFGGDFSSTEEPKDGSGISLWGRTEPCPKVTCFFLTAPCSSLHPLLPWLATDWTSLLELRQGDTERLGPKCPTGPCLVSEAGHPNWDLTKGGRSSSLPPLQLIFTEPHYKPEILYPSVSFSPLLCQPHRFIHASTNLINWGSESLPNLLKFVN